MSFGKLVALFHHLLYHAGVVGVQIGVEAAVAADLLVDLLLGVLAGEAHLDQVTGGHGAGTLGAEAALAVQDVVDIHDLAVTGGCPR